MGFALMKARKNNNFFRKNICQLGSELASHLILKFTLLLSLSLIVRSTCMLCPFINYVFFSLQSIRKMKTTLLSLICLFALCAGQGPSIPAPGGGAAWMERHNSFVANTASNPGIPIIFYGDRCVN